MAERFRHEDAEVVGAKNEEVVTLLTLLISPINMQIYIMLADAILILATVYSEMFHRYT